MRLGAAVGLAACLAALPARAEVEYAVDLAERQGHRATVEMVVRGATAPLELVMPVWTPGAYEPRTWGRNVTLLGASDGTGRTLAARRTSPSTFRVEGHVAGAEVRVRYRVYAAQLSDDGTQVDATHAYLNGTSMFLQARGHERRIHRVRVPAPAGWQAATALDETPSGAWQALSYEALVDAPIELGRFVQAETRAAGRTYRVVIDGAPEVPARLLRDVAAIAEAEAKLVGTPPYRAYLLVIHLSDGLGRIAALEHAQSASIIVPHRGLTPGDTYDELVYVIAHELFHAWNARRLRPAEQVPCDFSRVTPARSLWITEGVTEYYAHRAMLVAGKWSRGRYLERLGEEAARALQAARRGPSLEEDAELAWHQADEAGGDPDAWYARGHLAALALDASIRAATEGRRSLDDVVRALLAAADRAGGVLPVDTDVLSRQVAALAGPIPAERVLGLSRSRDESALVRESLAGLGLGLLTEEAPARTIAGFAAEPDGHALRVSAVTPNGPAAHAGLRPGDRILTLDGAAPKRAWADALAAKSPGAAVTIEVLRAARRLVFEVHLEARRQMVCKMKEVPVSPKVAVLRDAWLAR